MGTLPLFSQCLIFTVLDRILMILVQCLNNAPTGCLGFSHLGEVVFFLSVGGAMMHLS